MEGSLEQPGVLFTVLMFVVMIGPLVFIHELGHYLAGRWFGVKADSFSIGFGRELFGWTDGQGTRWKVSLLPLGGYVKFSGDLNASSQPSPDVANMTPAERARTFIAKPRWQRAIIVAAGPITNFLFAIGIFTAFIAIYGHSFTPAVVHAVMPGSPAAAVGLREGDRLVSVEGRAVERFEDIVHLIAIRPGEPVSLVYDRGGRLITTTVVPQRITETDRFGNVFALGRIGIQRPDHVIVQRGPLESVYYAAEEVALLTRAMVDTLVQVVTGRRSVKELGGPLKIAQFSGQQATMGFPNFVHLMALISINLGFINLLPVPMLDGGHLLMYAVEGIRRRPVSARIQEWAFMSGFALLISLMLILTWNDLASFGVFKHLAGLLS